MSTVGEVSRGGVASGAGAFAVSGRVATPLSPQGEMLKTLDEYKGVLLSGVGALLFYQLFGMQFLLFVIMVLLVPFYNLEK